MAELAVYQYETFDTPAKRFRRHARYGTASAIQAENGLVMLETRRDVAATSVDAAGWYIGPSLHD